MAASASLEVACFLSSRESRRRITQVRRHSVAAILLGIATIGCGDETRSRAIYALAHDLEHEIVDGTCERLFRSTLLPAPIAAALRAPTTEAGGMRDWDEARSHCMREFGRRGEFESFDFHERLVRSVEPVAIAAQEGISAAATARVSLDRAPPETVPLVEFRGKWRVVVVNRWSGPTAPGHDRLAAPLMRGPLADLLLSRRCPVIVVGGEDHRAPRARLPVEAPLYDCAPVRSSCCFRRPYGVKPRGL